MSQYTMFLLPYSTRYMNNKLLVGVEPVQDMFIQEPKHGILYLDSQNHMHFQRTDDLPAAPTENLFHICMDGIRHKDLDSGYSVPIYLKHTKRLEDLQIDEFGWVKPEILKEADKFYNGSFDDSF